MKNKIIFDPIHKYIEIPPIIQQIIDTPEFQRLRNIKQLGACYYIFPGASHNRFEHSLGVCHLSGKLVSQLKTNQPELKITTRQVLLVQIAGLIHDLGHACFSHFFDNLFLKQKLEETNEYIHHEYRSGILFKHIINQYKIDITDSEIDFINSLVNPSDYHTGFLFDIVSNKKSGLDCDKFDYITRDCMNLGLSYSFDYSRLISQARVINDEICYPEKVIFNLYDLYNTRYRLHKEIYTHPAVHEIEYMLLDIFNLVDEELEISKNISNISTFISFTDNIIDIIYFHPSKSRNFTIAKEILYRLKTRNLYKLVGSKLINSVGNDSVGNDSVGNDSKSFEEKLKLSLETQAFKSLKNEVILSKFSLDYNKGIENPVEKISFYDSENNIKNFKQNEISQLLPQTFKETYIRFYCKSKIHEKEAKTLFEDLVNS